MFDKPRLRKDLDWITISLYISLVLFGWFTIYEAMYDIETQGGIFETHKSFKQFIWIVTAFGIAGVILLLDIRFFVVFSYVAYGIVLFLLVAVLIFGKEIAGAKAWFDFGFMRLQPAEFAKFGTALALASLLNNDRFNLSKLTSLIKAAVILGVPAVLILMENETGSTLVFGAFAIVLYREGMPSFIMIAGLTIVAFLVASLLRIDRLQDLITGVLYLSGGIITLLFALDLYNYKRDNRPKTNIIILHFLLGLGIFSIPFWLPSTELNELISAKEAFLHLPIFTDYFKIVITILIIASIILGFAAFKKQTYLKIVLVLGVTVFSIVALSGLDFFLKDVLKPYQQRRLQVLVNPDLDPRGAGYQVGHSKIAMASGGLWGQGYLQGTLTKLNYVPDQSTDFIFCTIGEERGWIGTSITIILIMALLLRLIALAERQKSRFSRVYGYSVASIIFFHFMVNIGMTIGLFPVIGIPLPFFSYGGSSLWSFTILLFIMIKLDTHHKKQIATQ